MNSKLSPFSYLLIGVMLFALFFGAGNLIFPASLGQQAGSMIWVAVSGFLITGVGLPFLGVVAMGFSGSDNLQELASRIHPTYAILFTTVLYLTIGPLFATPRTGAVAYDIGISPFISDNYHNVGLAVFTFIFFLLTYLLSIHPSKLLDYIGKILAPGIVILLGVLLSMAIINPLGKIGSPLGDYKHNAFLKGFTEGYHTMDAMTSLIFAIIIITAIRELGVTTRKGILTTTMKSGLVAVVLLSSIYLGIAYLGATSTEKFGIFETGGPVLSHSSFHYFGTAGSLMLALIIILACLTTSIGLTIACGEYFHTLLPKVSYHTFIVFISIFCFIIANVGLANIIMYSFPILMVLSPLAIILIVLTLLSPIFHHARLVYVAATVVTLLISAIDGMKAYFDTVQLPYYNWLEVIISTYEKILPLYSEGLGWFIPSFSIIVICTLFVRFSKKNRAFLQT